jgi:hypothetical protein
MLIPKYARVNLFSEPFVPTELIIFNHTGQGDSFNTDSVDDFLDGYVRPSGKSQQYIDRRPQIIRVNDLGRE